MDKYTFTTKLNDACASDDMRPIMNCIHFMNGFAYASNGNIVVKQTLALHSIIEPANLDGKSIHKDSYSAITEFEFATATEDGIQCKDTDGREAFFNYFNTTGIAVPDFDKVISEFKAADVPFIGFSPRLMKIIMSALHCPSGYIRVNFGGISKVMYIDVPGVEDQCAILMPVLIENLLF